MYKIEVFKNIIKQKYNADLFHEMYKPVGKSLGQFDGDF